MKKNILIFTTFLMILSGKSGAQSCDMFEIQNVHLYLYPIDKKVSFSKQNDSVSYSIEKIGDIKYRVQKLLLGKSVSIRDYLYLGKMRTKIFKLQRRKMNEVSIERQKRTICLLE